MEELVPNEVRDCQEIARRSLALFGVFGLALGAPRNDIINWLKDEGLWNELSPTELAYLLAQVHTEKQTVDASWRSEALIVLLWAIQKVEKLPAPNEQCDTSTTVHSNRGSLNGAAKQLVGPERGERVSQLE